ncbi:LADA_0C12288g1_1 [Lachancea dasiensis]|uniref:LADA_0C12288g1_1 n=1 Tax=Lachancea dasiensis TaxID=1072105 RepID=A0A1G4J1U9_9SACH|nr:LADA_0C12288g1_1 [Lachancea dasiensis]
MLRLLQLKPNVSISRKNSFKIFQSTQSAQWPGSSSGFTDQYALYPQDPSVESTARHYVQQSERDLLDDDEESDIPDGGLQAYLALLGSFVGLLPIWGTMNSLGAIEGYISQHQLASSSSSGVSWIFSLYLTLFCASCVFTGAYFDRNGGFLPLCVGSGLFVSGLVATANCQTIWQFVLAFSVLTGVATGVLTTPLIGCIATWFSRKRGMAASVAAMGGSLGGVIFPLMLKNLYGEVGFPWAIRILALVCLVLLVFACTFARERSKPVAKPFNSRTDMFRFYVTGALNVRYFLDRKYLLTTLAFSLSENSIMAVNTYIASYAIARGHSESEAFTIVTVSNAVQMIGRYIPGYISDKYSGRFNTVIVMTFVTAVLNLVMLLPFGGVPGVLWAYVLLFGFASGSVMAMTAVCIAQISRTSDFGKRYSTSYVLSAFMTLPIIPICGTLIGDRSVAEFNRFILFASGLTLAGAACYLGARVLAVGVKLKKF